MGPLACLSLLEFLIPKKTLKKIVVALVETFKLGKIVHVRKINQVHAVAFK